MTQRAKTILLVIIVLLIVGGVGYLASKQKTPYKTPKNTNVNANVNTNTSSATSNSNSVTPTTVNSTPTQSVTTQQDKLAASPIATIETNFGTIKAKFYTADAPELTKNFIELAKTGYYDGLTFHRIISDFMIQGGDPSGNGSGGHSYSNKGLADEPGALKLKHERGALAWAKSSAPNSIGSQFYIVHGEAMTAQLNGNYSVFGQVIEGMDVVDKIAALKTDAGDAPLQKVLMMKVTISE